MKFILKPLFELITGDFALFGNVIYNYIAMSVVGLIAFAVAWRCVGWLYRDDIIDGRGIGSIIHWIVRLIVFVVVFLVFDGLLWLYRLVIAIPLWAWILLASVVITVVAIIVTIKLIRRKGSVKGKNEIM